MQFCCVTVGLSRLWVWVRWRGFGSAGGGQHQPGITAVNAGVYACKAPGFTFEMSHLAPSADSFSNSCTCSYFYPRQLDETPRLSISAQLAIQSSSRRLNLHQYQTLSAEMRAVRPHRKGAVCVPEKHPLISAHFLRVC